MSRNLVVAQTRQMHHFGASKDAAIGASVAGNGLSCQDVYADQLCDGKFWVARHGCFRDLIRGKLLSPDGWISAATNFASK
jgi:hypothetical protein